MKDTTQQPERNLRFVIESNNTLCPDCKEEKLRTEFFNHPALGTISVESCGYCGHSDTQFEDVN